MFIRPFIRNMHAKACIACGPASQPPGIRLRRVRIEVSNTGNKIISHSIGDLEYDG